MKLHVGSLQSNTWLELSATSSVAQMTVHHVCTRGPKNNVVLASETITLQVVQAPI